MSKGPEGQYVTRLLGELRKLPGSRWWKTHGGPWQEPGIPDIVGCLRGRMVAVEVKVKGNTTTPKQEAFLRSLSAAGALTAIVFTSADPAAVVRQIVERRSV